MNNFVVLMTGASGFIGTYLIEYLLSKNYVIIGLTRHKNKQKSHPHLTWVENFEELTADQAHSIDYVINLAGESIGQGRWTVARKHQLIQSRVQITEQLYQYLSQHYITPKCIISGSAVGFYGIDLTEQWTEVCTEQSQPQDIFMSALCQEWEAVTKQYPEQKTKIIRLGVVFGPNGGILPQMLMPIKFNLVGKIGSGRQPCVWVHVHDVARAIEFLMHTETEAQIFNVVAPEKVNQRDFVAVAATVLKRKPFFSLPSFVMKLLLGEQSQLILNGQYVKPAALQAAGFEFQYSTLAQALTQLLHTSDN
jgi:uncharacterized protein